MNIWWVGIGQYAVTNNSGDAGRKEVEDAVGPKTGINTSFVYDNINQLKTDGKSYVDLRKAKKKDLPESTR
jgi:hypothetical protein